MYVDETLVDDIHNSMLFFEGLYESHIEALSPAV